MSSTDSITNIWPAVNIYLIDRDLLLITETDLLVHGKADMLFQQLNKSQSQDEQINIQDSIHYLMVLLAWSVVALFSNS